MAVPSLAAARRGVRSDVGTVVRRKWRNCPNCNTRAHLYDHGWVCTGCGLVAANIEPCSKPCACGCGEMTTRAGQVYRRGHNPEPPKLCTVDGCDNRSESSRGWCSKHYTRWVRHGDPGTVRQVRNLSPEQRFELHTPNRGDGCWVWTGKVRAVSGYGVLIADGGEVYAHRWSHEHFVGPIPDGLVIRHSCDNPPCVNPAHLSVGTHADNARDKVERGRQTYGEAIASAKLTPDVVRELRQRRAGGETYQALADSVGLDLRTVYKAVLRQTWKHVL